MAMALAVTHPEDEADPWRRAESRMSRRNGTRVQHHELLDQIVPEASYLWGFQFFQSISFLVLFKPVWVG